MYPNTIALYLVGIFSTKTCILETKAKTYLSNLLANSTSLLSSKLNETSFVMNSTQRYLIKSNKCSTLIESSVIFVSNFFFRTKHRFLDVFIFRNVKIWADYASHRETLIFL